MLGVADGLVPTWGGRLLRGQGCVGSRRAQGGGGGAVEGNPPEHLQHEFPPKRPELEASGSLSRGRRGSAPAVGRRL